MEFGLMFSTQETTSFNTESRTVLWNFHDVVSGLYSAEF